MVPPGSLSSRRSQLLEWFPFYVHRLTSDARYRALKDYHQAWYLNLLFASWISDRPGYLPDDGQLWRLANARTRQFFEKECEPVLCMFEREGSTTDGAVWIYNRAMVEIYEEQVLKFHKKRAKILKIHKMTDLPLIWILKVHLRKKMEDKNVRFIRSQASRSGEPAGHVTRQNTAGNSQPAEIGQTALICGDTGWKSIESGGRSTCYPLRMPTSRSACLLAKHISRRGMKLVTSLHIN